MHRIQNDMLNKNALNRGKNWKKNELTQIALKGRPLDQLISKEEMDSSFKRADTLHQTSKKTMTVAMNKE